MSRNKKIIWIFIYVAIIVLALYKSLYVQIMSIKTITDKNYQSYDIVLNAPLPQTYVFNIAIDDRIIHINLNDKEVNLSKYKKQYFKQYLDDWRYGYKIPFLLAKGSNTLKIKGYNKGGPYGCKIAQTISLVQYLIIFLLLVLPFFYGAYLLFFNLQEINTIDNKKKFTKYIPWAIIASAILIRLHFFWHTDYRAFGHDIQGHIDAIKYYASNFFSLPQSNKGLEYPQQPLYYMLMGIVDHTAKYFKFNIIFAYETMRFSSILLSFVWLVYGYKLVKLYTKDILIVSFFLSFLAFTPSFVFMGCSINNDVLNMVMGIVALYYILYYVKLPTAKNFTLAIIFIQLTILVKISSLLYALFLLLILFIYYYRFSQKNSTHYFEKDIIKKRIFLFSMITVFIFGLTLIKVYIPVTNQFKFVNSALFSGQIIPHLDMNYFFTFHIGELIHQAQCYVFGDNNVRFSFFTYQYGTMFTGEYDYGHLYEKMPLLKFITQLIYLLGIVYVVIFLAYIYKFSKMSFLKKIILIPIIINLILILKFLSSYWDICNSDFRYYSSIFGAIGLVFALGAEKIIVKFTNLRKYFLIYMIIFYALQVSWELYVTKI